MRSGIIGVLALLLAGCGSSPRVVCYCAQDQEFAAGIFDHFHKQQGLPIAPHYDTEAQKSVSLYQELVQEKDRPRCDVFWNNEILSTIRLQRQGLLEPYACAAAVDLPSWARATDNSWYAFGLRARVLLVNTELLKPPDFPKSLLDLTEAKYKGHLAMAKPQYGSTATQAACLFAVLGPERAKQFFLGLRANGIQLLDGNKAVAVAIGRGQVAIGLTDTDDAIAEVKAGRPVQIIYPDRDRPIDDPMGTLFFPNTVMLLKGAPNAAGGHKLIDYLLGPEVEKQLAEGPSHQLPPVTRVPVTLPEQIETPRTVKIMRVNWDEAADRWDEAQKFLTNEFARPQ